MNKCLTAILAGTLLSAGVSAQAAPVHFSQDLKTWRQGRIGTEKNDNYLRVNVIPKASGNYGQLWKLFPAVPAGKYVQVNVEAMENSNSFAWVCTTTKSVKRRNFGVIFQGVNTYAPMSNSRFSFSICQMGNRAQVGSWINYDSYDISSAPENSIVAVKEPADGDLKVGDTLNFKIFRQQQCKKPVRIRMFTTEYKKRNLQNFKICKADAFDVVYNEKEKCYTASVKVTGDAFSLNTRQNRVYLVAAVELDGVNSYFTLPYEVKIETSHKVPTALFSADSPVTRDNRQMWYDMTLGKKNLALKKPVRLIPTPLYRLTRDIKDHPSKDAYDLTDGYITQQTSDKIWFDRRAVGFFTDGKFVINTAFLQLDLGSVQPVDYIALRALGGSESGFRWPKKFEVLISKDGKKFYQATEMVKLAPAEANQSDFVTTYYYPEESKWQQSVCKSFKLNVKADARYVIVKLTLDTHFFSDEMAVIAAETKGKDFNKPYETAGFEVPQDGLTAQPRVPELAIIKGVAAPQTFAISDFRSNPAKLKKALVILELPEPLQVFKYKPEKITVNGKKYNRFRMPIRKDMKFNPIFILSSENTPDQLPPANIYVEYDGKTGFKQSLPMKVVTLPEFKTFQKLPICLAWMTTETLFGSYPDLLKNFKRFGFNGAGVFPRYWIRPPRKMDPSLEIKRTEEIRNAGFMVFMNESPMHIMGNRQKTGSEVFCQTGKPNRFICPSYTGKFYQEEMDRVAKNVEMSKPKYVLLDIECFGKAFSTSAVQCSRCKEGIKKSGKNDIEYMYGCGTRMLQDFAKALERGAKAANIATPTLHMYGLDRVRNLHGICRFVDVYPGIIKSAQPSLYVGGHPAVVQKNIRTNHKLMGTKDIMPWLSTGCYGEYDSYLVEPIVLEALMNGAGGILNYAYGYFTDSPLDFYYHAQAVRKLAPYEELLIKGKVTDIKGSNDKMFYSMVQNNNEMLLLVGNYYKAAPATGVTLPYNNAEVLDLNTQKSFSTGKDFKFNVEPGKFSLFYIRKK